MKGLSFFLGLIAVSILSQSVIALAGAFPSLHGHCTASLEKVTRIQPWPEVPEEMIEALRRVAQDANNPILRTDDFFKKLSEALESSAPDHVVHALFSHTSFKKIKEYFGMEEAKIEVPEIATLTIKPRFGNEGLRDALGSAIGSINSDSLKVKWIRFMINDSNEWPKYWAALNVGSISDPNLRVEIAGELFAINNSFVQMAVTKALPALPPKGRWDLVKKAARALDVNVHDALKPVLKSFSQAPEPDKDPLVLGLIAWADDQYESEKLRWALKNYDPDWQKTKEYTDRPDTIHDWETRQIYQSIFGFHNIELHERWLNELVTEAKGSHSRLRLIEHDVLIQKRLAEKAYEYYLSLRAQKLQKGPDREMWLSELNTIAGENLFLRHLGDILLKSQERLRASEMKDASSSAKSPPTTINELWNSATIATFEEGLQKP